MSSNAEQVQNAAVRLASLENIMTAQQGQLAAVNQLLENAESDAQKKSLQTQLGIMETTTFILDQMIIAAQADYYDW